MKINKFVDLYHVVSKVLRKSTPRETTPTPASAEVSFNVSSPPTRDIFYNTLKVGTAKLARRLIEEQELILGMNELESLPEDERFISLFVIFQTQIDHTKLNMFSLHFLEKK